MNIGYLTFDYTEFLVEVVFMFLSSFLVPTEIYRVLAESVYYHVPVHPSFVETKHKSIRKEDIVLFYNNFIRT